MLTSIGRVAIRRLAAKVTATTTSSHRFAISRVRVSTQGPLHPSLYVARGLATQAAPKVSKKSTTTTAKKPVKKTTTVKKDTKVKAKAKAKAKPKAKVKAKAKPKPKPKPKPRKKLTDEEKTILQRKGLKKTALFTEPKAVPDNPWVLYVSEQTSHKSRTPEVLRADMRTIADAFKALPSSETQRLKQTAEQNKQSNTAAYKAWVETMSPQQVDAANKARSNLKKKFGIPTGYVKLIHDERQPKRPLTAYSLFTRAQWSAGNFPEGGIRKAASIIAAAWKNLPETEKKAYLDLSKSDSERYEKAVKSVLGRGVKVQRKPASP